MTKQERKQEERLEIVNKLIKFISEHGRRFFRTRSSGDVAYMKLIGNRVYYIDNYTKAHIYCKNGSPTWEHFSSGGTLQALVLDFADFIRSGKDSNGNNGYGGLHCEHWGYSEEDKTKVIEYAKEIGYLQS